MSGIVKFRTSRHIVAYWDGDRFVLHQFASDTRAVVDPAVVQVLDVCRRWRRLDQIVHHLARLSEPWVRQAVLKLEAASFLQRSDRPTPAREQAYGRWGEWNPVAGFFHSATRDVAWAQPEQRERIEAALRVKADKTAPPPPVKSQRGLKKTALPPPRRQGEFPSVLLARRTWRGFSDRPVPLGDLSTILWFTAGVQMWGETSAGERVGFKTSPSAGCKHPIELYIVARKVKGLRPGIYHYAADRHRLGLITPGVSSARIEQYLGHQWQFRNAGAIILMAAVMSRTQWTYPRARTYRSILAEAGHVCQTFCLVATWLDLAPFCTMALADSLIEKALGIDGVSEAVLYAAGVGMKPADGKWVQWPEHASGKPYTPPVRPRLAV